MGSGGRPYNLPMQQLAEEPENAVRRVPIARATFQLTDTDAFGKAVACCVGWLAGKLGALPANASLGDSFELACGAGKGTAARIADGDGAVWAARHDDLTQTADGRLWSTDMFVEKRRGALVRFGAQLILETRAGVRGSDFSRPRVIHEILSTMSAQADGVPLQEGAEAVDADAVGDLVDLLFRRKRRRPIVLVSRDEEGATLIDVAKLCRRISGSAHVRTISVAGAWELTARVGRSLSTFNRAVRIYLPGMMQGAEDPYRHPLWLDRAGPDGAELMNAIARQVLPFVFRDEGLDSRFWQVGLLHRAQARAARMAAPEGTQQAREARIAELEADLEEAKRDADTAQALMEEANAERERAEAENRRLAERIDQLTQQKTPGVQQPLGEREIRALIDKRYTVADALRIVAHVFPTRVVVLPSAFSSARKSANFRHPDKALELLWTLATGYHQALLAGRGDDGARKVFGGKFAAKEAETLSEKGRERRTFPCNGQPLFMEKHLKLGVKDSASETLRIHFEWLAHEGRIVIGHCGPHLDF